MKITKVQIKNVLSYKDATIPINENLNIFVGANGSGKSNLINIIIYTLKRYCFRNYNIQRNNNPNQITQEKYFISEQNPLYSPLSQSQETFLRKHKNLAQEPSHIVITLKFETGDIDNLREILKHKEKLCGFIDQKVENIVSIDNGAFDKNSIKDFFNIKPKNIKNGHEIKITITENNGIWYTKETKQTAYTTYMRYFDIIYKLLGLTTISHKVKNPLIFFEAYRNNARETTWASLSELNNGSYINNQSYANLSNFAASIGANSTYITMATKKFGSLHRKLIEKDNGAEKFRKNQEYIELQNFFKKFDFNINIRCVNPNDNIYQFYIIKNGLETEIDAISSGEREVINFIFGLFLDQLGNSIVIIDEPELHLHPSWQKRLIQIFKTQGNNKNIQIIFVTHSSSFISYNILNNIYRIYLDNTFSKYIRIEDLYQKDNSYLLRKQLSVINATNNEKIFFANAVILVEGITDEILFKLIYAKEFGEIPDGVEFVSISGKNNLKNFTSIIEKLQIPYFYIGDFDNIYDIKELKDCFEIDKSKQKRDLSRPKNQSYDCLNLLKSIEDAIREASKTNLEKLEQNFHQYNEKFLSLKAQLSDENKRKIYDHIAKLRTNNTYILQKGEIEQYLGTGSSNKANGFEKVISLYNDNNEYEKFKKTNGFDELRLIIEDIHRKISNLK